MLIATFSNCTISKGGEILFDPDWGTFDLACGTSVVSVYGGPADMESYFKFMDIDIPNTKKPNYSTNHSIECETLDSLYKEIREMRENSKIDEDRIKETITIIESDYLDDWLIRYELMEILLILKMGESQLYKSLESQIIKISEVNTDLHRTIIRGIESLEN